MSGPDVCPHGTLSRCCEVCDLWSQLSELQSAFEAEVTKRETVEAQLAEAQRDAGRYRKMRSSAEFLHRNGPGLYWYLPRCYSDLSVGERLDRALDEERSDEA